MFRSALRVFFSLIALTVAVPAVHAESKSATKKVSAKKHVRKSGAKNKAAAASHTHANRHHASRKTVEKPARKIAAAHAKPKATVQRVAYAPTAPLAPQVMTAGDLAGLNTTRDPLSLASNVALVIDQNNAQVLFEKNSGVPLPIASLTKLMTAMVVIEAHQDMNEVLEVTADDIDRERHSASRLRVGSRLTRADMLHIALMSSENRAASALGRNYPGGLPAFVAAMNAKAKALGMANTHYVDSTGLSSQNVASARDLAKLVTAAYRHPIIREYSTDSKYSVNTGKQVLQYINSNRLVNSPNWDIGLQKTGYITEAGRCLLMQARIEGRPVIMVFLDSKGKDSRLADAGRIRKWLEATKPQVLTQTAAHHG